MKTRLKATAAGRKAERALKEAVAQVVEQHRRLDLPLAVWRNGKAVWVPVGRATGGKVRTRSR